MHISFPQLRLPFTSSVRECVYVIFKTDVNVILSRHVSIILSNINDVSHFFAEICQRAEDVTCVPIQRASTVVTMWECLSAWSVPLVFSLWTQHLGPSGSWHVTGQFVPSLGLGHPCGVSFSPCLLFPYSSFRACNASTMFSLMADDPSYCIAINGKCL